MDSLSENRPQFVFPDAVGQEGRHASLGAAERGTEHPEGAEK